MMIVTKINDTTRKTAIIMTFRSHKQIVTPEGYMDAYYLKG